LGANVLIAEAVSHAVSDHLGILRAPTFSYGVSVGGGPFAGAIGLRPKTPRRAANELLAQWKNDGVEDFVIITGHRFEPHLEALLMALTATSSNSVYDLCQIHVADVLESNPAFEHGGELETSLLPHLAPKLVHMEEAEEYLLEERSPRRYTRGRVPTPPAKSRGVGGYPRLGTKEKGRVVFDRYLDSIAQALTSD
jgi:creatinine amidohydrolase